MRPHHHGRSTWRVAAHAAWWLTRASHHAARGLTRPLAMPGTGRRARDGGCKHAPALCLTRTQQDATGGHGQGRPAPARCWGVGAQRGCRSTHRGAPRTSCRPALGAGWCWGRALAWPPPAARPPEPWVSTLRLPSSMHRARGAMDRAAWCWGCSCCWSITRCLVHPGAGPLLLLLPPADPTSTAVSLARLPTFGVRWMGCGRCRTNNKLSSLFFTPFCSPLPTLVAGIVR